MLKKEKKRAADADTALKHAGRDIGNSVGLGTRSVSQPSATDDFEGIKNNYRQVSRTHAPERAFVNTLEVSYLWKRTGILEQIRTLWNM